MPPRSASRALAAALTFLAACASAAGPDARNGHEPAHSDYRVTEDDFRVFERGLADARKVAPRLFARGVVDNDAVLYDTHDLYIYSRSKNYRLPKFRERGGYQVYRVALGRPVEEHEMAICDESPGPASVDVLRTVTERALACAPWGAFGRVQKERRSIYRFVEGYWASIIHEYGHEYRDYLSADPSPEILAIDDLIARAKLPANVDRERAADEGFAIWCELQGARALYPSHYRRMLEDARRNRARPDDFFGHDAGLRAAVELSRRKSAP